MYNLLIELKLCTLFTDLVGSSAISSKSELSNASASKVRPSLSISSRGFRVHRIISNANVGRSPGTQVLSIDDSLLIRIESAHASCTDRMPAINNTRADNSIELNNELVSRIRII